MSPQDDCQDLSPANLFSAITKDPLAIEMAWGIDLRKYKRSCCRRVRPQHPLIPHGNAMTSHQPPQSRSAVLVLPPAARELTFIRENQGVFPCKGKCRTPQGANDATSKNQLPSPPARSSTCGNYWDAPSPTPRAPRRWTNIFCAIMLATTATPLLPAAPAPVRDFQAPSNIPPPLEDWNPDPEHARRLTERAKDLLLQELPTSSLELLQKAMAADTETNPSSRPYYALRAAIFEALGDLGPTQANELYNQGLLATNRNDFALARLCYDKAITADPDHLWAANNRAWLGATHPEPLARNDPEIVRYALYACIKSNWRNWSFLDTLSAAYAERGDFPTAIRCAERAFSLAPPEDRAEVREAIRHYEQAQPRRQNNPATATDEVTYASDEQAAFDLGTSEKTCKKHREIYFEFLAKQGYRPEVDEQNDVAFRKEGGGYFISVSEDPNFFKIVYPMFFKIDSPNQQLRALRAIEQVGREVKVVKLIVVRDHVWAVAESFVPDQTFSSDIFDRSMAAIRVGTQLFAELMGSDP